MSLFKHVLRKLVRSDKVQTSEESQGETRVRKVFEQPEEERMPIEDKEGIKKPSKGEIEVGKNIKPLLDALLSGDDAGYHAQVISSLKKEGEEALDALCSVLRNGLAHERRQAAFALAEITDHATFRPVLEALSSDDDAQVRAYAAQALGKMEDKGAVGPLIQSLRDSDPVVKKAAAQALGSLGDDRAIEPLKQVAREAESWQQELVVAVNRALTRLGAFK